jgi:hypothetical protein
MENDFACQRVEKISITPSPYFRNPSTFSSQQRKRDSQSFTLANIINEVNVLETYLKMDEGLPFGTENIYCVKY